MVIHLPILFYLGLPKPSLVDKVEAAPADAQWKHDQRNVVPSKFQQKRLLPGQPLLRGAPYLAGRVNSPASFQDYNSLYLTLPYSFFRAYNLPFTAPHGGTRSGRRRRDLSDGSHLRLPRSVYRKLPFMLNVLNLYKNHPTGPKRSDMRFDAAGHFINKFLESLYRFGSTRQTAGDRDVPTFVGKRANSHILQSKGYNIHDDKENSFKLSKAQLPQMNSYPFSHILNGRSNKRAHPLFVGKRSLRNKSVNLDPLFPNIDDKPDVNGFVGKRMRDFVGKRNGEDFNNDALSVDLSGGESKRSPPSFIGKRLRDFVGKRAPPGFVGKRLRDFVGKRAPPSFVGKRTFEEESFPHYEKRLRDFVGKRAPPSFVGKRGDDEALVKRLRDFVGKRARDFVGKRESPSSVDKRLRDFVGKRGPPSFVGKRAPPSFVGKRARDFVGKRTDSDLLLSAYEKRRRDFVGKRSGELDNLTSDDLNLTGQDLLDTLDYLFRHHAIPDRFDNTLPVRENRKKRESIHTPDVPLNSNKQQEKVSRVM